MIKHEDKYAVIGENINEYVEILASTIIQDYVAYNEECKSNILLELLGIRESDELTNAIKKYIIPKKLIDLDSVEGFHESFVNLLEETTMNNFKLLSLSLENLVVKEQGVPKNKTLSKEEANELLLQIKRAYIKKLEDEVNQYDPEVLLFVFYSIADRLAILSDVTRLRALKVPYQNPDLVDTPLSILINVISKMESSEVIRTSNHIGREKQFIDIIFNLIYKIYSSRKQKEHLSFQTKMDIRKIYPLAYMVATTNLFLMSNELLYEQGEALKIKDWTLEQTGDFNEQLQKIQLDIIKFNYNENAVNAVFEQYSKREGFCPNDLFQLAQISMQDSRAQIHLQTFEREKLEKSIVKVTNVKDYGINRFLDVLTLNKDISDIADSANKISVRPFLELNDGNILFSPMLLLQASHMLETRMLQQSFTINKKLQKFISKNYDEAFIADLASAMDKANVPYLEHVHLDSGNNPYIKELFDFKGITKEFDLIFIKENVLYVVEYKTWKISSFNIVQVLNEQKKITKNITNHNKAIEIIKANPNEFRKMFGEKFYKYDKIELMMVFQNPTAFKYLNDQGEIKVFSPIEFNDFINN
ncbi:hypothetical protein YDYSY3_45130 [Paenibacillus chitinolyticus]|uniref:hypothetical protein n=1 Tax=Paenibacillus chitinolyticus TaxID=79263 RepID=UPI0026E4BCA7|nr:hypothetical protein [Paenibacillus chitinolyticus]GKS13513.1 hypothetical protein YDYSY3_45130 [Paenibacillus chitinolyticus]